MRLKTGPPQDLLASLQRSPCRPPIAELRGKTRGRKGSEEMELKKKRKGERNGKTVEAPWIRTWYRSFPRLTVIMEIKFTMDASL